MTKYNPQLRIEFTRINDDGSESPSVTNFFGQNQDLRSHDQNHPILVEASINKQLGSNQQTANITITNSTFVEEFRQSVAAGLDEFSEKRLRVRIWAWWDDNSSTSLSVSPNVPPVFVGDIIDGFEITPDDIIDHKINLQAHGHGWLAQAGKMKRTLPAGNTYLNVVTTIFDWMTNIKGYGYELLISGPTYKIDDRQGKLAGKSLKSSFSLNRNPTEALNDICRDLDMIWGINNNIPYITSRSAVLSKDLIPTDILLEDQMVGIWNETGLTSLVAYNMNGFSFNHLWDNELHLGRVIAVGEDDQINIINALPGRINDMQINVSNYESHKVTVKCSYLKEFSVSTPQNAIAVLPEKNDASSGRRIK